MVNYTLTLFRQTYPSELFGQLLPIRSLASQWYLVYYLDLMVDDAEPTVLSGFRQWCPVSMNLGAIGEYENG